MHLVSVLRILRAWVDGIAVLVGNVSVVGTPQHTRVVAITACRVACDAIQNCLPISQVSDLAFQFRQPSFAFHVAPFWSVGITAAIHAQCMPRYVVRGLRGEE